MCFQCMFLSKPQRQFSRAHTNSHVFRQIFSYKDTGVCVFTKSISAFDGNTQYNVPIDTETKSLNLY
jgi:hypothetical protein